MFIFPNFGHLNLNTLNFVEIFYNVLKNSLLIISDHSTVTVTMKQDAMAGVP